ncbi:LOW QUALITY PROTEIN: hypothetical protein SPRG_04392 [Saprolegnia parasitica CBS 223.65]|uniref:Uncharacterized protein n=1 Tax=Saprolegnia parasitica (strain CBS 223.65) TaxID=695850 RepID=A0A067CIB9_SAPPC|nr:LOW QUALITY PROTEIN: hypothetical protein SPRG_04392 [Saprolegnia parasitica CBS 223.65]KDO30489.1 LOW QUALITY PROTEIN: hypothetical protein SPRG_04392 [Saprolegnia parasitica CBS 223.65]|eukprot:XP_012198711.1 LOW QUALITY PROTEIN: hypothetical protein SPRG_04392 [Saprolegnia parasitica CBS 223.65]
MNLCCCSGVDISCCRCAAFTQRKLCRHRLQFMSISELVGGQCVHSELIGTMQQDTNYCQKTSFPTYVERCVYNISVASRHSQL